MNAIDIDIWSDVMCPWCAVGYARLERALALAEGEIDATIRWMPYELNPDAPPEGKPQAAHLGEVYGRSPAEVAAMHAQMAATAAQAGFSMEYSGDGKPPEPMMWNTFEAHCLLRWALSVAGPEAQTRLKQALFAAHFQQRRNVSDRAVLLDIAAAVGLDRAAAAEALADDALGIAVKLEERRARENGITAVPTFVINNRYILQGAQEPEQFARALLQIANMEAGA